MNEFLSKLTQFGLEGMNPEGAFVEAYENSECAEEYIELDNLDAMEASMESMSDAILETGLSCQTLALEAAGFTLDTASGFTGELSTEAVGNMMKRGYYEVKIQVKKAAQKIWKLIVTFIENFMGSEGRLKSYGKLFKKYNERLSKINPKDTKEGDEREVTIRKWDEARVVEKLQGFKMFANPQYFATLKNAVKTVKGEEILNSFTKFVNLIRGSIIKLLNLGGASKADARSTADDAIGVVTGFSKAALEKAETEINEKLKDIDAKSYISDVVEAIKDVDSDDMPILTAKAMLLQIGRRLEDECKKDVKFKAELVKLKKAWDKKFSSWDLKNMEADTKAEQDTKDATAAFLRIMNKLGSAITGYRMAMSKIYSANASNLQGVLADMAKVISKGTNVGA